MKDAILSQLNAECPWRDTLLWFDTIDSTNDRAKQLAAHGAIHGTVIIADQQTGGRGRMGRNFSSPDGMGIYLSVILRPDCPAQELMHLTCCAAVAACEAIEQSTGFLPAIKWINDLIANGKKLGGILTELSMVPGSNRVQSAVIGIGINCSQFADDFPDQLRDIAISLQMATGKPVDRTALAAALIASLYNMDRNLHTEKASLLKTYRDHCLTLGSEITILQADTKRSGTALDIDSEGSLLVRLADGTVETVQSGEVSIRGIAGYL